MRYVVNQKINSLSCDVEEKNKGLDAEQFYSVRGVWVDTSCLVQSLDNEISVRLSNGTTSRAVLYISDATPWPAYWRWPRFHIFYCETLKNMRSKLHRYRASGSRDGRFVIDRKGHTSIQNLQICRKCLKMYNQTFKPKQTLRSFQIKDYMSR